MLSLGTTSSRHNQPFVKQGYAAQVPKGFTVRVCKGPAVSSFPLATSAKFDSGYRTTPLTESRQSHDHARYSFNSRTTSLSTSTPTQPPKSSRTQLTDNSTSTTTRRGGYESSSRSAAPTYSIYQSAQDTYVYEPSLSSKSDTNSNSEYDDASTATFTPSSTFSPAMSTDSITTLRGAITPDVSLTDLRSTTPSSFRTSISSFPIHIPGLSQAQSAIRGIFRSQTPQESQSSYVPRAPSPSPTPLPRSADPERLAAPMRLSATPSGSRDRSIPHDVYSTTSSLEPPARPYERARSPTSDSEFGELDRVARANAEYNAASSASSSAYYSARDSLSFSTSVSSAPRGVSDTARQIYTNIPLRSSPEQQHAFVHTESSYSGERSGEQPSSHYTATDAASGFHRPSVQSNSAHRYEPPESEGTITTESEQFIPPLGEWEERRERRQAPPVRSQSEDRSPSQIPEIRNEGPSASRYVPASRTMLPNSQPAPLSAASPELPVVPRENDHPLPVPPPRTTHPSSSQRERRTSGSQARVSSTPSLFYTSQGDGAPAHTENDHPLPVPPPRTPQPVSSQRERRTSVSRPPISRTSSLFYASRGDGTPLHPQGARDDEPRRTSPVDQQPTSCAADAGRTFQRPPSRHYVSDLEWSIQRSPPSVRPLPAHEPPSISTSPEQAHRLPSTHDAATSQKRVPAPPQCGPPSNTVTSATSQQPITSSAQAFPLRTSPDQVHRLPSAHYYAVSEAQAYAPAPAASGGVASNYVGSSATRRPGMSSPQSGRNSVVMPSRPEVDPNISANSIPTPSQSRSQQDVRNSPPQNQRSGYDSREPHISDTFTDQGSARRDAPSMSTSKPARPPPPVSAAMSQRYASGSDLLQVRTRRNSELRRFDSIPNHHSFAPPSVSSDPGPENESRRTSILEPRHTGVGSPSYAQNVPVAGARALPIPVASTGAEPETMTTIPEPDAPRSRTPFQDAHRSRGEPRRRHSDGEESVASGSYPPPHPSYAAGVSTSAVPLEQPPQRRYSDGDQIDPNASDRKSLALFRTVRWNENLICPSPIFAHQRKKGWFNRRGDQLWTNDGAYKPAPPGQEYPPDLDDYPEHGEGWMNEECIRIDMSHRLIPKPPLKSALKQTRAQQA
ncbi:hypothetical protein LshimejAT787_0605360 [Lyophyllum shimeji]|uniref:Uncharacterized protein n=1 Tax=Lyophyllum shimeji TaxID=47721 RepID=A0A9P3PPW5_LYOSH|nr:hypothetical protein LshimejAT787_0605360 [Lyophyllum shimeji]